MKKLLPIILIITMTSCHQFNQTFGISDNDPIELALEEVAEEIVEHETGIHLHLTPNAPIPVAAPPIVSPDAIQPAPSLSPPEPIKATS